jgi:hypothetical protein
MNQMLKIMLRRCLMTLGGIFVWAKALAGGRVDGETQLMAESDQKTAAGSTAKAQPRTQIAAVLICSVQRSSSGRGS